MYAHVHAHTGREQAPAAGRGAPVGYRWAPRAASVEETVPGAGPGTELTDAGPLATRAARGGAHAALDRSRPLSRYRLFHAFKTK